VLLKRTLLACAAAVMATLASSAIPGRVRAIYPGTLDCQQGCDFVAGGWPFPYLVDHPGISPTGSVSLVNGVLGVDLVWPGSLAATFLCWLGLFVPVAWLVTRLTSHGSRAT
jgi:hypothetical protein